MVVIASLFWLLKALDNNYISTIKYPVRFYNFPKNKQLIEEPLSYLSLKVEAHGFKLLRYKLQPTLLPVNIYVNEYPLTPLKGSPADYFLISKYITNAVSRQLSEKINIIDIKPDSLLFKLSSITSKKVPVRAKVSYKTQMPYMFNRLSCNPDSVTVQGPVFILDTLKAIQTKNYNFGLLNSNSGKDVFLDLPQMLKSNKESTYIQLIIDKYTETTIQVPIQLENVPDSLRMITFPDEVSVKLLVPVDKFNNLKSFQFKVSAHFPAKNDLQFFQKKQIGLKLEEYPDFVKNVHFSPVFVDYLLKKK